MKEKQPQRAIVLLGEEEEIEALGLPLFTVYASKRNKCLIVETREEIEAIIAESIKDLDKSQRTLVYLLVEIMPVEKRRRKYRSPGERRRRTGGGES